MQRINILLSDFRIPNTKTEKVISETFNLFTFNLSNELIKLISENKKELSQKFKSYIDKGEIIPTSLMEEFLKNEIDAIKNQGILFVDFPKTIEQFLMLEKITGTKTQTIWHIKQTDYKKYLTEYFKNPNEKLWLDKYGDEVINKWKDDVEKRQTYITELQQITKKDIWKVIEVDYETELHEQLILNKINDCT